MEQTLSHSKQKTLASREEWLKWRSERLGSSDAPIVMGVSPYLTPRQLWEIKLGMKAHEQSNMAIDKGNHWEPKVRAMYELQTGLDFPPTNFEDGALCASLDGYNKENNIILEIKVPGKEVMEAARNGVVHEMYVYQLEHQLWVSGAKEVHFVCATTTGKGAYDGEIQELAVVIYKSDQQKRVKLVGKLMEFWEMIQTKTPPPLMEADTLRREDAKSKTLFSEYKKLHLEREELLDKAEALEKQMDEIQKDIVANMKHNREECDGLMVLKVTSSRVDHKALNAQMEKAGIDPEQFKKESSYYRFKVVK